MVKLSISQKDILLVLMDYLKEHNLHKTLKSLQNETKISLKTALAELRAADDDNQIGMESGRLQKIFMDSVLFQWHIEKQMDALTEQQSFKPAHNIQEITMLKDFVTTQKMAEFQRRNLSDIESVSFHFDGINDAMYEQTQNKMYDDNTQLLPNQSSEVRQIELMGSPQSGMNKQSVPIAPRFQMPMNDVTQLSKENSGTDITIGSKYYGQEQSFKVNQLETPRKLFGSQEGTIRSVQISEASSLQQSMKKGGVQQQSQEVLVNPNRSDMKIYQNLNKLTNLDHSQQMDRKGASLSKSAFIDDSKFQQYEKNARNERSFNYQQQQLKNYASTSSLQVQQRKKKIEVKDNQQFGAETPKVNTKKAKRPQSNMESSSKKQKAVKGKSKRSIVEKEMGTIAVQHPVKKSKKDLMLQEIPQLNRATMKQFKSQFQVDDKLDQSVQQINRFADNYHDPQPTPSKTKTKTVKSTRVSLTVVSQKQNEQYQSQHMARNNTAKAQSQHQKSDQKSGIQQQQFLNQKFNHYSNVKNTYGLSQQDFKIFDDRMPDGFQKVRLISKLQHQVFWLCKKKTAENEKVVVDEDQPEQYYILQQIPRDIQTFEQKVNKFHNQQSDLFKEILRQQGMHNYVVCIEEVIDKPENADVWLIFQTEVDLDKYYNLHEQLWSVQFDPKTSVKTYTVNHQSFYKALMKNHGKSILANIILKACQFLKNVGDAGAMYCNLRTENILIKLNQDQTKLEGIKFLNPGQLIDIEYAQNVPIPDQIEHLPPEMLQHLITINSFRPKQLDTTIKSQANNSKAKESNLLFLQSAASADIFSLGVILLQISSGCPAQLELPVKVLCKTVENKCFVCVPHFGNCKDSVITEKYVSQTIKLQERLLNNRHLYQQGKRGDLKPYGLLNDPDFVEMMTKMISPEHYMRPNVTEVIDSAFVRNWTNRVQISSVMKMKTQKGGQVLQGVLNNM